MSLPIWIWTNKSLTGLQRPQGVKHLIASPEEALAIAARTPIAGLEGGLDEGDGVYNTPEAGAGDFGVRAYNSFWVGPGNNLALVKGEYRTSYIIDPPDGRVPRRADPQYDFDRDNFGSRYATGIADFSGPEAFLNSERCLLGFGNKAGPGMMSALYNNTYQFTVEESNIYSQAWTAELSFYATEDQLYEYACHEGNYSMPGSLAGARTLELRREFDLD